MPLQMQRAGICAVALDLPLDARAKIVEKVCMYIVPEHLQTMSAVVLLTFLAAVNQVWAPARLLVSSVEIGCKIKASGIPVASIVEERCQRKCDSKCDSKCPGAQKNKRDRWHRCSMIVNAR